MELWTELSSLEGIKISKAPNPLNFDVVDFSVYRYGLKLPDGSKVAEDDWFRLGGAALRNKMRRGLTFIKHNEEVRILRRGLPKFFDVPLLDSDATRTSTTGVFTVVAMEKANGENAQVTRWNDLWVICSKNVALLAANAQDLLAYADQRYTVAREIAEIFFSLWDTMSAEAQVHIASLCETYTLIGELVGVHQHLIAYEKPALLFYALVPLEGDQLCVSPASLELLDPLPRVAMDVLATCPSWKEVTDVINQENDRIKLEEGTEGRVLYVFDTEVVALVKTKSIEYRALRKLREKGKQVANGTEVEVIHEKYMKEMEQFTDNAEFLQKCSDRAEKFFAYVADGVSASDVQEKILDLLDAAK